MAAKASKYLNRELSWLEFNQRVLDEAHDTSIPLLERLKFLAITSSNLDEFFMVRVGGLHLLKTSGNTTADPSGMTPGKTLKAISLRAHQMMVDQYQCLLDEIEPALAEVGFHRAKPQELSDSQRRIVEHVFRDEIYPVFTPMAVTPEMDFPYLMNQTLNMIVRLAPDEKSENSDNRFAIIPFGRTEFRFITLPSEGGYRYLPMEDVVSLFIENYFQGENVLESIPFRVTKNADVSLQDEFASDLLHQMEDMLDQRKKGGCIRLEVAENVSIETLEFLERGLDVLDENVYRIPGPLDLTAFMRLTDISGFDAQKAKTWPPQPSPDVDPEITMFENVSRQDILLCHPYESFEPIVRLIEEAAVDPDVLAIKQILYRTSKNSPIVAALIRAAEQGKHVTALVELKARFDEARNIEWAKNLEHAGVQVIYGVKGLKTHAKICCIVRREPQGIQRYLHFGTGNYNDATAKIYSDISYFTCDEALASDAVNFFNSITGYSQPQKYQKLEAAPISLRDKILDLIQHETERKKQGQKARIVAKVNSLVDPQIIDALYEASEAGVKIKLNIRGICCLRPGVSKLSKNIEVVSIIDRFLEHARIFYFYHGGDERVFISSADWMQRNLDRRVELLVPIEDKKSSRKVIKILNSYFEDNAKARILNSQGVYERITPSKEKKIVSCQQVLYEEAVAAVKQAEKAGRTTFEPHMAPGDQ
ncbi:polyphosphate kinase 1 [uncultured Gimesia sp.]|uniref:polyphosphate kinase 1 n=1 Tax=uncultured Gimesia sp. TaxID=1678688 RepID=UPI0026263909|nr:polyphosphate kinase 1 [uncultured Gimesia sp.]